MTEHDLLNSIKENLIETIKKLDFENLSAQKQLFEKQLDLLESLYRVYEHTKKYPVNQNTNLDDSDENSVLEHVEEKTEENNSIEQEERPVYTFERKIRIQVLFQKESCAV